MEGLEKRELLAVGIIPEHPGHPAVFWGIGTWGRFNRSRYSRSERVDREREQERLFSASGLDSSGDGAGQQDTIDCHRVAADHGTSTLPT